MQSVVENLGGLSQKIKVTVPQGQVNDEFNKRIKDITKNANIKGFRKGKVPVSVVKLQYGEAVKQEVLQDILLQNLQEAMKEHKINPAGTPQVQVINFKEDQPFEFEAVYEIYPEIKVDIADITVERPSAKVEDAQVTEVIEKLRHQNVKWNEADKPAEIGDLVVINFKGFIDDEAFEGGAAEDFRLELGKKMMIPGFEEPIYGTKSGEKIEINVTFPEDYHAKQFAGKAAKFLVTVNKVMTADLPPLDDAFAKDLGVSDGTLAGLTNEVRANLERELDRRIHDRVKSQLIEKILEKNNIEVPQASVEAESKRLQEMLQKQYSAQGLKGAPALPLEQFKEQARKNVILGLLLSQWVQDNEIKVDPAKVKDRIDQIASGYHQPTEIVNWYYSNKEALAEIEGSILEEQAINKILEKIDVVEKEASFDEIMNVGKQEEGE